MSVELEAGTPGIEDASAHLNELLKQPGESDAAALEPGQREQADGDRAAEAATDTTQKPVSKTTDTPAAADQKAEAGGQTPDKKVTDKNNEGKTAEQIAAEKKTADEQTRDGKGRYAKAQERLEKTWDGVNKRKTELDTREQGLTQREQQLQTREAELKRQAEESQAQHKPEDYEKASTVKMERAKALHEQADGKEAIAEKFEDEGKYTEAAKARDEAKSLRKRANKEEGNAEDLKAHADNLRKNPPATNAQREQQIEAQRKEWTMKAAQDFPELGKKDSELQKTVSAHLNELWKTNRTLASEPTIIYHVTRLAAAEAAAARVPALDKEIGQLKAKVKEYEVLTAPGGPGSAQRTPPAKAFNEMTADEQAAALNQQAAELGAIR